MVCRASRASTEERDEEGAAEVRMRIMMIMVMVMMMMMMILKTGGS